MPNPIKRTVFFVSDGTGLTVDLMYLCGGGIVSHPGGPAAGVRAVGYVHVALDLLGYRHGSLNEGVTS